MHVSQGNAFLDTLTHDVRLAIYARIVLPPFEGCREYLGLPFSCRQIYNEIDHEGTRRLRMFLQDVCRTSIAKHEDDRPLQEAAWVSDSMGGYLQLQFKEPTSVLRPVVVFIKVPFTLPPTGHDWYLQPQIRTLRTDRDGASNYILHRPRIEVSRTKAISSHEIAARYQSHYTGQPRPLVWHQPITIQHHPASRIAQQRRYATHIEDLLKPIEVLHRLHADIQVQLTVDEETVARISQELVLHSTPDPESSYALDSTALGWVLELHMNYFKERSARMISARRRNWAFNTRTMDIVWSMTSSAPIWPLPQLPQSHWSPREVPNTRFGHQNCHEYQLICTDDCREGMVRLQFHIKKAVQFQLDHASNTLQEMEPERRQTVEAYIERLEYDIFYCKEKLSVLGVAGYKQSGSLEEREEELNKSWRKRREGI